MNVIEALTDRNKWSGYGTTATTTFNTIDNNDNNNNNNNHVIRISSEGSASRDGLSFLFQHSASKKFRSSVVIDDDDINDDDNDDDDDYKNDEKHENGMKNEDGKEDKKDEIQFDKFIRAFQSNFQGFFTKTISIESYTSKDPIECQQTQKQRVKKFRARGSSNILVNSTKCPECHCTFPTNAELRKHLKCHSDARLFTCATCRSTYELESKLMKHLEKNRYHVAAPVLPLDGLSCDASAESMKSPVVKRRKMMQ